MQSILIDTLGKLHAHAQRPPPHSISRILAPRLVALTGFLALVWLAGRLWAPGAPPPAAISVVAPVAAPAMAEPVAPAVSPVPVSEMPRPAPEASEPAAPPPAAEAPPASPPPLEFAPPPPATPAIAAPRDLRPEYMSDARLLNLLELRRNERMPRRQR